jgi:hypothetical protein
MVLLHKLKMNNKFLNHLLHLLHLVMHLHLHLQQQLNIVLF